jgi:hypothetical protein
MSQVATIAVPSQATRIYRRSRRHIEEEADLLLASYAREHGGSIKPPIPVEEILEFHLGYSLYFDDLQRRMRNDKVLGALDIVNRRVVIDERLSDCPKQEPRLRYTVSHEGGHIVLHVSQLSEAERASTEFESEFICSDQSRRNPLDREADYFAACLLMPRMMFLEAFYRCQDFVKSLHVDPIDYLLKERLGEQMFRHMLNTFNVSRAALAIRFLDLGLYYRDECGRIMPSRAGL